MGILEIYFIVGFIMFFVVVGEFMYQGVLNEIINDICERNAIMILLAFILIFTICMCLWPALVYLKLKIMIFGKKGEKR